VFDPVLCELAYRWFCPPGGTIVDPFAGGSVRGVIASMMGFRYWGCELRGEQVIANRSQWVEIVGEPDPPDVTPIETRRIAQTPPQDDFEIWVKRDDLYAIGGGHGGKVRACWHLARGAQGLVTAGSRSSPQVEIVSHIAARLGIPCRLHMPKGELELDLAPGAEPVQHDAGYNSVIIARAKEDAQERGWTYIPFGMECHEAAEATASQVRDLPDCQRIVVPVGSGMTLAGILHGLDAEGFDGPIIGVRVGADPSKRLDSWAPADWRDRVQLVESGVPYEKKVQASVGGLELDPVYEAKCVPFLEPGDLFWVVGRRRGPDDAAPHPRPTWVQGDCREELATSPEADFVFSCPPYGDLEVYSDDPADLSNMDWRGFQEAYRDAIYGAVLRMKQDSFACFVVGNYRAKKGPDAGIMYDLSGLTVAAFERAGAKLYNEAVLLTSPVSAGLRVSMFDKNRKLVKVHQNVLVFVKGDGRRAADKTKDTDDDARS
jgi:1-aminocyclopropane-1-carboxylate deaminase/D-cysteine desulfhydrase-like pyridoxal-dependent ACC family enzyme